MMGQEHRTAGDSSEADAHFTSVSSLNAADIVFADDANSALEHCGFVCHVAMMFGAVAYTVWILAPTFLSYDVTLSITAIPTHTRMDSTSMYQVDSRLPAATAIAPWTVLLPTIATVLFVLIPVTYGLINATIAAKVDAIETIHDIYSIPAPPKRCNDDYYYYRNPWKTTRPDVINGTDDDDDDTLPEICDLNVADINNLVWRHRASKPD